VVIMATLEKVDVVIVGAGASGSVFAAVLARAGKRVVLLEQGPNWEMRDLVSSEIWGRRLKPTGSPFQLEGRNAVGFAYNSGWGVGGATLHYFANFPRLLPTDFRMKSEFGRGLDWPITYDDLAPYYDRVARDVGVSGDAEAERRWRPVKEPYPMPPLRTFRHGEIWVKGFEALGMHTVPAPVAINSVAYKGRPACIYDGWCHVGCPTGALANPQVTYLAEALGKGAVVRPHSTVTRVLTNAKGERVSGVEYFDQKKERQVQEASVVVLAAFSAQNPRILLNSATDRHPQGLANASGLVGRYLMTHTGAAVWGIFDEHVENYMGITGAQRMSYDRYPKTSRKGAFGSTFWVLGPALKPNDLGGIANARGDLFGLELDAFMKRAARGLAKIQAFGEELPNPENRLELSTDKDEFGFPLARIFHTYDQDALGVWSGSLDEGMQIAKAAGAKEAWPARAAVPTIHLCGGTIMGTSAGNSVVNSYGQTHELANLYIGGPGIYPTEGASNPTYALNALSLRGAEQLAANWTSIAG